MQPRAAIPPTENTTAPDSPPDWSAIGRDILCPLCDYNLRGLVEPRCPECGHQFNWKQMLDAEAQRHPYLFEHQPQRNFWSFFQTLRASLFQPGRFWTKLLPIHQPNRRRLVLYWMIVGIISLVCFAPAPIVRVGTYYQLYASQAQMRQSRVFVSYRPTRPSQLVVRTGPPPSMGQVLLEALRSNPADLLMPVFFLLWPAVTLAALMVYRISMRRARIHSVHVLRCVIYSADANILAGLLVAATTFLLPRYGPADRWYFFSTLWGVNPSLLLAILVALILLTYRLSLAYQRYLRFPHAVGVVAASQFIVFLIFYNLLFLIRGW
jgi:hypothetical protein